MPRPVELWIAVGLVLLAAGATTAALVPLPNHLEESCSPMLPPGDSVRLDVDDRLVHEEGLTKRVIDFTPAQPVERIVLHACIAKETRVERAAVSSAARVELTAWGVDLADALDEAEVKMRGVLFEGHLHLVPRIELHGRDALPLVAFELRLAPGATGDVEPWP